MMSTPFRRGSRAALAATAGAVLTLGAGGAQAGIDWPSIPGKELVLFYPGQGSFEWMMTVADHSGATKFREGKTCYACHKGEERQLGANIVGGKKIEPTPISGKPEAIPATVKFARDADNLYVHVEFAPGEQPNSGMDPKNAAKLTVMFADARVPEAGRAGCWVACHDNLDRMASGKNELTKYLMKTRTKIGRQGGDQLKPDAELEALKSGGYVMEYWQAQLNAGAPAVPVNGIVAEKREDLSPTLVTADAQFADGAWKVTLARKLDSPAPHLDFADGGKYMIGVAVHAGHTAGRFHYVSLEQSMVVGSGSADFVAVKK